MSLLNVRCQFNVYRIDKRQKKGGICMTEKKEQKITLPCGKMCGYRCDEKGGCAYWVPDKKDSNGRQYCRWYECYYYPREREGCLSYK